jgi:23S rRNA pseudouridine1911/1915/1917 synthase
MIICKTDEGWNGVHEMLKERRDISKQYHCIVLGRLKDKSGEIKSRIGRHPKQGHKMITSEDSQFGKDAHTDYVVLQEFKIGNNFYSLLNVKIHTGRTHQIRVHMASLQHPIVGDGLYSTKHGRFSLPHLLLVSKTLKFTHPIKKQELSFDVDYPPHFDKFLRDLQARTNNEET